MPNLNPQDARTYNPAPTLWKYDPQTNILWLKLTDAFEQHLVVPHPPQPVPPVSRLHRRNLTIDRFPRWLTWALTASSASAAPSPGLPKINARKRSLVQIQYRPLPYALVRALFPRSSRIRT
jgi:hypothetical protein